MIYAFPRVDNDTLPENDVMGEYQRGMLLRDYFAAKAMQAMLSNDAAMVALSAALSSIDARFDRVAALSYLLADAMLAAREK